MAVVYCVGKGWRVVELGLVCLFVVPGLACSPLRSLDQYGQGSEQQSVGSAGGAAGGSSQSGDAPAVAAGGAGTPAAAGAFNGSTSTVDAALGQGGVAGQPSASSPEVSLRDASAEPAVDGGFLGDGANSSPELVDAAVDAQPESPCPVGELGPAAQCFVLLESNLTWPQAREACLQLGQGWDLAAPQSAADSEFLAERLQVQSWLGATDAQSEGTWRWIHDEVIFWQGDGSSGQAVAGQYTNWNSSEPNGGSGSNCARAVPRNVIAQSNADWADLTCGEPIGAVCQRFEL